MTKDAHTAKLSGDTFDRERSVDMGDVINLNKYRKQRERAAKKLTAEANRLKHGESKSSRTQRDKQRALEENQLDGHKLESKKAEGRSIEE